VGVEATGPICWFVRLHSEFDRELWIGDAAKIHASEVHKQKTDERDALLIFDLLLANRFPKMRVDSRTFLTILCVSDQDPPTTTEPDSTSTQGK
jgi:hypothetical protein